MVHEGLRQVAAGANPMGIKRGMDAAVAAVTEELHRLAKPVNGKEEIAQVATISAQDPKLGDLIAQAFDKVGRDGVITVEESSTMDVALEYTEGMQFDKGYISPYFVTDAERMETVLEDVFVLLVQNKIASINELLPLMEKVVQAGKPLIVIAEDVEGDALSAMIVNKIKGTFTSIGGAGDKKAVDARVAQIRAEMDRTDSSWDKEKLQERLAKISGGVAVIQVGGATEVELKETKFRVEDAISATRAAIEEGIVAGGGSALTQAVTVLKDKLNKTGDEAAGVEIIRIASVEPLRWIAQNAGAEGYVVTAKVAEMKTGEGYNAATGEFGNLLKAGIVDPVKVTRSALQNAASIAAMLLTTDVLIVEKKADQVDSGNGHSHGPGGHSH